MKQSNKEKIKLRPMKRIVPNKKRLEISRDVFESIIPWAKYYNKPPTLYIEELLVKSYMKHEIVTNKKEVSPKKEEEPLYKRAKRISTESLFIINPLFWIVYGALLVKQYFYKKK